MIENYFKLDFLGMKVQTHATLSGLRGILRYANIAEKPELIDFSAELVPDQMISDSEDMVIACDQSKGRVVVYDLKNYKDGDIIDDYDITKMMSRYFDAQQMTEIGVHHIAAKLIGGGGFNNQASNGEMLWDRLCEEVESGEYAPKYEYLLYYTVKHNEFVRKLAKSFIEFDNIYRFLLKYEMIDRIPSIENTIEGILEELVRFTDISRGYYHPMCNMGLANIKTEIKHDLEKSEYYQEYIDFGLIKKNILDGYDAGWLSPDGEFYGDVGEVSAMIHMNLAEQIYSGDGKYGKQMKEDKVSRWSTDSPEQWLQKKGWVKIHHQDCYGSFIGSKDWTDYPYCPTPVQIKMICKYADTLYNGKFYTEYNSLGMGRHSHPDPYSTYAVKQMDDIMLHKIFS